jgi:DNA-binding NarL/FixJ family response regulator
MLRKARKKLIYLVDDHPVVRESLTGLLNQEPELLVCGEADEVSRALREISSKKPDLVIVDLALTRSSGFDLIKDLRRQFPEMLIVVFSMHDEKLYAERCIRAGANGYVMKRESTKRFLTTIRDVLDGRMGVSEPIASMFLAKYIEGRKINSELPMGNLSDRELEVFNLLGQGLPTKKIAQTLDVNIKTVQTHCAKIKQKLHVDSATELLREATKWCDERSAF